MGQLFNRLKQRDSSLIFAMIVILKFKMESQVLYTSMENISKLRFDEVNVEQICRSSIYQHNLWESLIN
jgi:hypothetical protein